MTALHKLCHSVVASISSKNWYAATVTSLTLPDICYNLDDEFKSQHANAREGYASWYDRFVGNLSEGRYSFLPGRACYYLRCKIVHQSTDRISNEEVFVLDAGPGRTTDCKMKQILLIGNKPSGWLIDQCIVGDMVVVDVDSFCNNILSGVEDWARSRLDDKEIIKRIGEMLEMRENIDGINRGMKGSVIID